MADPFGGVANDAQSTVTSQYPVDIASMIQNLQGSISGALANPLSSNLFKGTIGPLLESLRPSEEAARTALADQFRMAGGGQGGALQSGAFAKAAQLNEQNILQNRSNLIASRANDVFRNILAGLGTNVTLLHAIRPTGTTESRSMTSSGGTAADILANQAEQQDKLDFLRGVGRYAPQSTAGASIYSGASTYDPYSPQNPGRTPEEKEFYSRTGFLPGDVGYSELYDSAGGGYNAAFNPATGQYESTPFSGVAALEEY